MYVVCDTDLTLAELIKCSCSVAQLDRLVSNLQLLPPIVSVLRGLLLHPLPLLSYRCNHLCILHTFQPVQ